MIATTLDSGIMAKTPPTPSPDDSDKPSETVRLDGDLMEILREMCFHTRNERNRRPKVAQMLDTILRPVLLREYEAFKKRQGKDKKEGS